MKTKPKFDELYKHIDKGSFNGQNLHQLRIDRELSVADLGQMIGVEGQTILTWERGKKIPSWKAVGRLMDVLGVRYLDEFFGGGYVVPTEIRDLADRREEKRLKKLVDKREVI